MGAPRELADAKCAWRKLPDEKRLEFLYWAMEQAGSAEDVERAAVLFAFGLDGDAARGTRID